MGAQGTVVVDFGAFPGQAEARATVTGQAGLLATSLVEAWPSGTDDTADHSSEEHSIEDLDTPVETIVVGTGFDVIARPRIGRCYGQYNVNWVWSD